MRERNALRRDVFTMGEHLYDTKNNAKREMKATLFTAILVSGILGLTSCSGTRSLNSVSANSIGSVGQLIPGTVTGERTIDVEATDTSRNLGTGVGAAIGAGAGSLLGRGKGQIVSSVGFGVLGALAGREVGEAVGKTKGQILTIKADAGEQSYTVTQPIYKEIGAIQVGTHGNLQYSGAESKFLPDGF